MLVPNPVQTTYTQYLTAGQNGMPATTTGWDVDTKICENVESPGDEALALRNLFKKGWKNSKLCSSSNSCRSK